MAKANEVVEPIADEPEIIESPSTHADKEPSTEVEDANDTTKEQDDVAESYRSRSRTRSPYPPGPGIMHRDGRNYTPSPRPRNFVTRLHEVPNLISTKSLSKFIQQDDVYADTASNQMVYIANHPFASADLDKISWLFRIAAQDTWVQKPTITATAAGYKFDFGTGEKEKRGRARYVYDYAPRYVDDNYDRMGRPGTIIVRLGHALRVFKSDGRGGTEKVKFVVAVQGKNNAGWVKLVVAHSRQAALVDVFHEIVCGHSVLFLGAVLVDVVVPLEVSQHKKVRFQRVAGLKEAQEVGEGVVGVIC